METFISKILYVNALIEQKPTLHQNVYKIQNKECGKSTAGNLQNIAVESNPNPQQYTPTTFPLSIFCIPYSTTALKVYIKYSNVKACTST